MKCPRCQFENPAETNFCGKCGTQLIPSEKTSESFTKTLQIPVKELPRGITFAERFEVIEELGKGGMGTVYRVVDKKIEEDVALKILNPEVASDEKTIQRFRNELKLARKISHKNVCRMYDLNEEEGTQYITMEYVPGEDLKSTVIRVGQLSVGKALSIARQVCEGLIEAHRIGVIHRDLKPQNIMLDREGNARIMDFGIARSLKAKGITDGGVIIGTPDYMSPEQVEGKGIDQRTDIYSLGVILYEMVTGRVPFEGETPLSIAVKQKSEIPVDPREINAQIPDELSRTILKCMEKSKEKRYQTTEELLSELNMIDKTLPTTERILPRKKTLTAKEITVQFSLKKLYIPALVIIVCAIAVVIITSVIPKRKMSPFPPGKPSLAIMYFENNTGDENLGHWRKALSDLLIADVSQSKLISVLSGEKLYNILEKLNLLEAKSYSSNDLKEVAKRGGVEHVLVGKMAMAGDAFRIDVMLHKASTEEIVGSERVEGRGEENIFSMVDELTKKIKANFKLSAEEIAGDIDEEAGTITTSSPEAYKYYSEGMKFFNAGDYLKSIPLMETAVAMDPDFAMAYRAIAVAYTNIGYTSEAGKRLQKAFELRDRVSERERYYIQGFYSYQSEKTYDNAIAAYNKLLELYPDDIIGNNSLGILYANLEEWDESIKWLNVNIQNKIEFVSSYVNIGNSYIAKGLYDKAKEVLENYLNTYSDNAVIHHNLALNYLAQGKYGLALAEVNKSVSLDPAHYTNFFLRGLISLYKGNLIKAENEFLKILEIDMPAAHNEGMKLLGALYEMQGRFKESREQFIQGIELAEMLGEAEWKSWFHLSVAYSFIKSGNSEEALRECNKAWINSVEGELLSKQIEALYCKGIIYLEMNSMEEAQKVAGELKDLIQKGKNRKRNRFHLHLMGMIEIKKENFTKAIEYFNEALSLLPSPGLAGFNHVLYMDSLASAYFKSGDVEKAQEVYEKLISLSAGRLYHGDIFALDFYRLAKISQEKGLKEKAVEYFERFLALWKNADSGIPEVIDAEKQLTGLRAP